MLSKQQIEAFYNSPEQIRNYFKIAWETRQEYREKIIKRDIKF